MDSDTILFAFLATIVANLIEIPLFWWFSRPERLMKRLSDPSEVDRATLTAFFNVMLECFTTPSIKTGEKVQTLVRAEEKDSAGNIVKEAKYRESDEVVSPLDLLIERMGKDLLSRIRGLQGSIVRDLGALPRKGQSNLDFMLQKAMEKMMPSIEKAIDAKLNKPSTEYQ